MAMLWHRPSRLRVSSSPMNWRIKRLRLPRQQSNDVEVRMVARREEAARLALAAGRQGGGVVRRAEQRLGELEREGAFAHSLGADEQVRRGEPARREGAAELLDDGVVTLDALPHGNC